MLRWIVPFTVAGALLAGSARAPIAERGELLLDEDFSGPVTFSAERWQPRQSTRWEVRDGVLFGQESTKQFQESRKDHQGFEPRLMIRNLPQEYITEFRFRVSRGEMTPIGAFLEWGHHMARVSFQKDGLNFGVGGLQDTTILARVKGFQLEPGHWYTVRAELKGQKLHIRLGDDIELSADHPMIAQQKDGLGFCGLRGGTMEIDDVKVWAVR
ncbi:MAG: hypothetical protein GC160_05615 [Acidobacteria bacterium]|nr:hypothetical protein [Acidobacteriota bacterium]